MANQDPMTGKWTGDGGGSYDSAYEADAASRVRKGSGGSNFQSEMASGGFKVLIYLAVFMAGILFLASNVISFLILAGIFIAGILIRKMVKRAGWYIRFPVWLITWAMFIVSIYCVYQYRQMIEDPVISAFTTVTKDAEIEKQRKITDISAAVIGQVKTGTRVRVWGATRNKRYLIIETANDEGKTINGFLRSSYAEPVATTYILPFKERSFQTAVIRPHFLRDGTYESNTGTEYTFQYFVEKKSNPIRLTRASDKTWWDPVVNFIKVEQPIEINGSFYNYKMEFSYPTREEYTKEYSERYVEAYPYEALPSTFSGEYVITSNTSFIGPNGRTWNLKPGTATNRGFFGKGN